MYLIDIETCLSQAYNTGSQEESYCAACQNNIVQDFQSNFVYHLPINPNISPNDVVKYFFIRVVVGTLICSVNLTTSF